MKNCNKSDNSLAVYSVAATAAGMTYGMYVNKDISSNHITCNARTGYERAGDKLAKIGYKSTTPSFRQLERM